MLVCQCSPGDDEAWAVGRPKLFMGSADTLPCIPFPFSSLKVSSLSAGSAADSADGLFAGVRQCNGQQAASAFIRKRWLDTKLLYFNAMPNLYLFC